MRQMKLTVMFAAVVMLIGALGFAQTEQQPAMTMPMQKDMAMADCKEMMQRHQQMQASMKEMDDRLQQLVDSNFVAAARMDQARDEIATARARLASQQAAVQTARARRDQAAYNVELTVIRAPQDGRIVRRYANPGAGASTLNVSTMFDLEPDSPRIARAEIVESDIPNVTNGQAVEITPEGDPSKVYVGTVLRRAAVFGARKLASDDPSQRSDERVIEVVVTAGDGGTQANDSDFDPELIESPNSPYGKLMRIDLNANFPTPASDPTHAGVDVVALGLRNPYRSGFDRQTGDLWLHTWVTFEETVLGYGLAAVTKRTGCWGL